MKIAYVTTYDAPDVRNWSGSGHYIAKALEQQALQLHYIGSFATFVEGEHSDRG